MRAHLACVSAQKRDRKHSLMSCFTNYFACCFPAEMKLLKAYILNEKHYSETLCEMVKEGILRWNVL